MPEIPVLLSTAYFAPVHFYARFLKHEPVYIEQFEHFIKQTYRNRCIILAANGPLALVVPVVKGRGRKKIHIKDIQISYDEDWQRIHWRSLFSAYNSSPFFEFYRYEIHDLFTKKRKYLFDLNMKAHEVICAALEIEKQTMLTTGFENVPENTINLREKITPKKAESDEAFQPVEYTQVFSERSKFVPDLSILDLLFNEGPNSYLILESSFRE